MESKALRLMPILVIVTVSGQDGFLPQCRDGWTRVPPPYLDGSSVSRSCVKLYDDELVNWMRAKAICVSAGGNLVEVNTPRENEFLQSLQSIKDLSANYWTGGNDLATRNRWVWTSRGHRIYPYVNWQEFRPDWDVGGQRAGRCIALEADNFEWVDSDCEQDRGFFFCEYALPRFEVPTTTPAMPTTKAIWHDQISFDGNGFVKLDKKLVSHDWDMRMEMTVEFSTWSRDAIILWQGRRSRDELWGDYEFNYMALGIKEGYLVFDVNDQSVSAQVRVDDGEVHEAYIEKLGTDISIKVDGVTVSSQGGELNTAELKRDNLYLGGIPDAGISENTAGLYDTGYAGCIHYFGVHNHHVSKIEEGEEGGKVMGGRSYGGQVDFSNFHLNRDSEGAVSSELCILEDRVTEEPTTTQKPQTARPPFVKRDVAFDGKSHIQLRKDVLDLERLDPVDGDLRSILLNLDVSTTADDGLLLWFGERSGGFFEAGNFVALGISDGYVELQLDFGNQLKSTTPRSADAKINDGETHTLTVDFRYLKAIVGVDGNKVGEIVYGDDVFPVDNLFVGNMPSLYDKTGGLYSKALYGCLQAMSVSEDGNKVEVDFVSDAIGQSDAAVGSDVCSAITAKPTSRPTFRPPSTMEPTTPAPCIHKELSFDNSDSYVQLKAKTIGRVAFDEKLQIIVEFTSFESDGVIIWQGSRASSNRHYFALAVKDGYLECHFYLGDSGASRVLKSRSRVDDGSRHRVVISKLNANVKMSVDGGSNIQANMDRAAMVSLKRDKFYVGGHEDDLYTVSGGLFDTGFTGCIHEMDVTKFMPGDGGNMGGVVDFTNQYITEKIVGVSCEKMCRAR